LDVFTKRWKNTRNTQYTSEEAALDSMQSFSGGFVPDAKRYVNVRRINIRITGEKLEINLPKCCKKTGIWKGIVFNLRIESTNKTKEMIMEIQIMSMASPANPISEKKKFFRSACVRNICRKPFMA
jgi:hypothetical protein